MAKQDIKQARIARRKRGIRKRVVGTPARPRLSIYRSSKHIYAQVIDDLSGQTLVASSSPALKIDNGGNVASAQQVGKDVAEKAKDAGLTEVAFDRGGFRYHGRVKALADAAREGGLKF